MAWSLYNAQGALQSTDVPTSSVMTMFNVKDWGAKGDGSTDDAVAINAAIASAAAAGVSGRGVDVYFPAGVYAHAAVIVNANNNVMLRGAGWQSTVLYYTAGTGDQVQIGNGTSKAGCGLMNMSVWASGAKTTGASININAMNDCLVQNFVINNCFQGILLQGISLKVWIEQGEINNIHAADGIGIQITNGAGGDTYLRSIVMSNNPASKPLAGITITSSGHCEIINCNVTSALKGLVVNPTGTQLVTYLFMEHTLFDSCNTHGAHFTPSGASTAKIQSVMAIDCWFSGTLAAGSGIEFTIATSAVCDALSFIGCRILNNYNHGVTINAGPTNISFTDCTLAGNGQQTSNTYDGISVAANVVGLSLLNCKIGQAGTAGNQQRYAINIAAGTSGNIQICNNDCQPNGTIGTHGYINIGALTGGGINIAGNTPQMDGGMGSTTVGASGSLTTTETVISAAFRMGANALRPGTVITIRFAGSCTVSSAAAVPGLFRVKMGTAGTTGDGVIETFTLPTSGAVGTSVFDGEIQLVCRTVGASASFAASMRVQQASATLGLLAAVAWALAGTAATGSSINNNYLTLQFGSSGSANVACTFQIVSITVDVP